MHYSSFLIKLFFVILFILFSATEIIASVNIDKFYKDGTNKTTTGDWIELKNNSDSEYNLRGHRLEDTASTNPVIHSWDTDFLIAANASCKIEVGNRLNKDGDVIYLIKESDQLDCVGYGNKNDAVCEKEKSPSGENDFSESNCYIQKTPEPTTRPTSDPTQKPTTISTPIITPKPNPTVLLTPKPTQEASLSVSNVEKSETQKVLAAATETVNKTSMPKSEDLEVDMKEDNHDLLPKVLITLGALISLFSVGTIVLNEYRSRID